MSASRRITGGALLIASLSIVCSGSLVYFAARRIMTRMALAELNNLVETGSSIVNQASRHAIVSNLRGRVDSGRDLVAHFYNEFKLGHLSEQDAQKRAADVLLAQRIGTSGYVFCLDSHGVLRVHPKPSMVGRDMSWHFLAQQQLARTADYIEYQWKNPDDSEARPKALYQGHFAPWDWMITATSYREEFRDLVQPADFRNDLLSIKIGETGYLLMLDMDGKAIIHPTMEGKNMAGLLDESGRPFVKEILANKNGSLAYTLQNPRETAPRRKIAVYKYIPEFKWILVSSAYEDELFAPLRQVRIALTGALIGSCLLALLLSAWFGRGVVSAHNARILALDSSLQTLREIIEAVPVALIVTEKDGKIQRANEAASAALKSKDLVGRNWTDFAPPLQKGPQSHPEEATVLDANKASVPVHLSSTPLQIGDESLHILAFIDLSERKRLESDLRQAQKLEAVGQLAAGVAHEINTPTQFVSDNVHFLTDTFADLRVLLTEYRKQIDVLIQRCGSREIDQRLKDVEKGIDLDFVMTNIPSALDMAKDGIAQIAAIVLAMKDFAHVDRGEKVLADIDRALQATLTVARNEYKYVADVETDFGQVTSVPCHIGEMKQVFLNLIINAAHAVGDAVKGTDRRGVIRIRTRIEGGNARIDVEDSGMGIPDEIRDRVFEPFFTTKEVGRGTGQGLPIARSIIEGKHGGSLSFTSEVGKGTTFTVRIPMSAGS